MNNEPPHGFTSAALSFMDTATAAAVTSLDVMTTNASVKAGIYVGASLDRASQTPLAAATADAVSTTPNTYEAAQSRCTIAPLLPTPVSQASIVFSSVPGNNFNYSLESNSSVDNAILKMQTQIDKLEKLLNTTMEHIQENQQQRLCTYNLQQVDRAQPAQAAQQHFNSATIPPTNATSNVIFVSESPEKTTHQPLSMPITVDEQMRNTSNLYRNAIQQPNIEVSNIMTCYAGNAPQYSSTLIRPGLREQQAISLDAAHDFSASRRENIFDSSVQPLSMLSNAAPRANQQIFSLDTAQDSLSFQQANMFERSVQPIPMFNNAAPRANQQTFSLDAAQDSLGLRHHKFFDNSFQPRSMFSNAEPRAQQQKENTNCFSGSAFKQPPETSAFNPWMPVSRKLQDLPEFKSEPELWPMFSTAFYHSTAAYKYSNFENCSRLQKCLKGMAYETVKCLLIHPDNVHNVMKQLEFRFGRPELLIASQLREIREVRPISEIGIGKLIPFSTKARNLAVFLQSANAHHHLANPTLLEELVAKLPISRKIEWARFAEPIKPYPTVLDFSHWLSEVANIISTIPDVKVELPEPHKRTVMHTNICSEAKSGECHICKENHKIYDCQKFLNKCASDRWADVKRVRLCFSCLGKGHSSHDCRRKQRCSVKGCSRIHHKLLHEDDSSNNAHVEAPAKLNATQAVLSCASKVKEKLLFRILPVILHGKKGHVSTYALMDEGSSITLVDKSLIEELGLKGTHSNLDLQWIGGRTTKESATVIDICINGVGRKDKYILKNVHAVENLNLPVQSLDKLDLDESISHFQLPPFMEYKDANPKLLIGLDNCHLSLASETIHLKRDGPFATNTKLGWVVFGASRAKSSPTPTCLLVHPISDAVLHDMVNEYFSSESFGVRPAPVVESDDDIRARKILQDTTKKINDRYQTGLLWKYDNIVLPESYSMAKKRLINIEKKMKNDIEFSNAYRAAINGYVEKGYARKLEHEESELVNSRTWYLPHFAVINVNKPKKLRLVFDAAATVGNVSLNSCLLKGPQDYQPLPTVLFNFRIGAIAICGDIKEMFHQVLIRPEDRCAQRFLWRDGNEDRPPDVYEMVAMTFGAACSPCSAQYVKIENAKKHTHFDPRSVKAIVQNHYVDDFVDSFESVESAVRIAKEVIEIHKNAGFKLRGFTSNSWEVAKALNGEQCTSVTEESAVLATEKVLGMFWHPKSDTFRYHFKFHRADEEVISGLRAPTKRELLSIIMSVFDPLGLMSHLMITAKLIMREVWKFEVKWDDPIPENIVGVWMDWRADLKNVLQVEIPRHYFRYELPTELQLHIFVDSSEIAFAAAAYWRTTHNENEVGVSLICAKTRCAPQKPCTVPRLELQAAVLGTRLMQTILQEHELIVGKCVLWSDSSTVIKWIQSKNRRYKPFVAHRINEILNATEVHQWRWVPTQHNVADDATRLRHKTDLSSSSRWFTGPSFLKESPEKWPSRDDLSSVTCDDEVEIIKEFALLTSNSSVIEFCRFSSFTKLKRSVAWALRFVNCCRFNSEAKKSQTLTLAEIQAAERMIFRLIQSQVFASEIQLIDQGKSLLKGTSLFNLMPYKDSEGILRVDGRINAASWLPYDTKHPIILPPEHEVTALIMQHIHNYMMHQNLEATICEIRQRFWVPRLRQVLKKTIGHCVVCKLVRAKPAIPVMGQLPEDRLAPYVRPFTYTGIDYFGPLLVTIGRRREKRWVALFTCLTMRAIHLEVAFDLSTDACILAIRNFINRRGTPLRIRSDNGKNFVGLEGNAKQFSEVFDNERIQDELSSKGIEWLFNCPMNPSEGGIWERMVRCVKRVLNQTLKEVAPREHTLQSFLVEAETIINSRPLTHIPVSTDEEEPITPNHFLLGCANTAQTPALDKISKNPVAMRKQWRISRQLRDHFWKHWIAEYLPTLTRREKWCERSKPIEIGDLV